MKANCTIEPKPSTPATKPVFSVTENTMRRILAQPKPADTLALYAFLTYTAQRQGTQTVKAMECFIARGLQWSEAKVRRVKRRLRDMGLIETITRRNKSGHISGHYLRVSFSMRSPSAQNTTGGEMSYKMLCDEKVNAIEEKSKETSAVADASFSSTAGKRIPAVWKPDTRSREDKLAALASPRQFPSEQEFEDFLTDEFLNSIIEYRPDLYRDLCLHKWRHWDGRLEKWTPIRCWEKYVMALDEKILASLPAEYPAAANL